MMTQLLAVALIAACVSANAIESVEKPDVYSQKVNTYEAVDSQRQGKQFYGFPYPQQNVHPGYVPLAYNYYQNPQIRSAYMTPYARMAYPYAAMVEPSAYYQSISLHQTPQLPSKAASNINGVAEIDQELNPQERAFFSFGTTTVISSGTTTTTIINGSSSSSTSSTFCKLGLCYSLG